jgi:hypothetical protein
MKAQHQEHSLIVREEIIPLVVLEAQHQEHSLIVREEALLLVVVVQPQVHSRIVQEEMVPLVVLEAQHQARSITAREEKLLLVVIVARYQGNYTTVDLQRVRSKHWLKEASCVPVLTAQIPSLLHLIMKGRNKLNNIEMHSYYTVI